MFWIEFFLIFKWTNNREFCSKFCKKASRKCKKWDAVNSTLYYLRFIIMREWAFYSFFLQAHCANLRACTYAKKSFSRKCKKLTAANSILYHLWFLIMRGWAAEPNLFFVHHDYFSLMCCNTRCTQFCNFVHHAAHR